MWSSNSLESVEEIVKQIGKKSFHDIISNLDSQYDPHLPMLFVLTFFPSHRRPSFFSILSNSHCICNVQQLCQIRSTARTLIRPRTGWPSSRIYPSVLVTVGLMYWTYTHSLRGFLVVFDLAQIVHLVWISIKTRCVATEIQCFTRHVLTPYRFL